MVSLSVKFAAVHAQSPDRSSVLCEKRCTRPLARAQVRPVLHRCLPLATPVVGIWTKSLQAFSPSAPSSSVMFFEAVLRSRMITAEGKAF